MQSQMSAGYELSPQQKQLFAQNRENATEGLAISLQGKADIGTLRRAAQALVDRHEILRTSFQRRTGMKFPFQVVHEGAELPWSEVDLSAMDDSQQRTRIEELLSDSSKIDIEKGVVFHATLAKLGPEHSVLGLTLACLCSDHASLSSILSEFKALYSGQPVSEEVLQYPDYSEWQNEELRKEDEEDKASIQFWKKIQAESLPVLGLPFEHKRPGGTSSWDKVPIALNQKSSGDVPAAQLEDFLFA